MPKAPRGGNKRWRNGISVDGRNQLQGNFPAGGIMPVHCPSVQDVPGRLNVPGKLNRRCSKRLHFRQDESEESFECFFFFFSNATTRLRRYMCLFRRKSVSCRVDVTKIPETLQTKLHPTQTTGLFAAAAAAKLPPLTTTIIHACIPNKH